MVNEEEKVEEGEDGWNEMKLGESRRTSECVLLGGWI